MNLQDSSMTSFVVSPSSLLMVSSPQATLAFFSQFVSPPELQQERIQMPISPENVSREYYGAKEKESIKKSSSTKCQCPMVKTSMGMKIIVLTVFFLFFVFLLLGSIRVITLAWTCPSIPKWSTILVLFLLLFLPIRGGLLWLSLYILLILWISSRECPQQWNSSSMMLWPSEEEKKVISRSISAVRQDMKQTLHRLSATPTTLKKSHHQKKNHKKSVTSPKRR